METRDYTGWGSSIDLGRDGTPRIAYVSNGTIKLARRGSATWDDIQTVDSDTFADTYVSLALDGGDNPHLVYHDHTSRDLKYAHWTPTGWEIEPVDTAGDVGRYAALAVDSARSPHISYYDRSGGALKYAVARRIQVRAYLPLVMRQ